MKLTCPNCGAPIAAGNINVQTMVAVCGDCDSVFAFDAADTGRKRRKVRQPGRLRLDESPDTLTMRYRRVFNQEEQGLAWGNGLFVLLLPVVLILTLYYKTPFHVPLLIALWGLFSWYVEAALLFNRTTVTVDQDRLEVDSGPLPWVTSASKIAIDREDLRDVVCEETEDSRRVAAVKRYYHVRARLHDGQALTLLKGMPQDYAFFIAQELNASARADSDPATLQDFFEDDTIGDHGDAGRSAEEEQQSSRR
jgi:hypothetical protein